MNTKRMSIAAAMVGIALAAQAGEKSNEQVRISMDLADGSRLIGTTTATSIPFVGALGKIEMSLGQIRSVQFNEDRETAVVLFVNNDQLTGVLDLPAFPMQTLFGRVDVPLTQCRSIAFTGSRGDAGLVLHYTFDEDESGGVKDSSGRGNDGYTVGSVQYETGRKGKGARFTGPGSYILSDAKELNTDGWREITVSLWCRFQQYTTYGSLIGRGEVAGTRGGGFGIQLGGEYGGKWNTGGRGVGPLALPTRTFQAGVTPYPVLGQWYHVCMTYDGQVGRFYVNGSLDGEARGGRPGQPLVDNPTSKLVIGTTAVKPFIDWSDMYFNGTVDEVRIYRRALSEEEIKVLCDMQRDRN